MKVYRVMVDNRDEYESTSRILGVFSTREKAEASGIHYCEDENKSMSYEDQDGYVFTYDSFYYEINEDVVDEYFIQNLSPLAKAIEE